jgi:hypothetical protein
MKKIAIYSFIDRDSKFIKLWHDYYRRAIKSADLFLLTRNNDIYNFYSFIKDYNIYLVNIDNKITNKLNYLVDISVFENFQKELLQKYDIVIYTDIDEFIVHNNLESLLQQDFASPIVTKGINLVQHLDLEADIDLDKKLAEQRDYIVYSEWYDKPLIVTQPISWFAGKHNLKMYNNYIDGLYLIDISKCCFKLWQDLSIDTMRLYAEYTKDISVESYRDIFSNTSRSDHTMVKMDDNIKSLLRLI